jgi:predicted Zn-dependent peptidase
MVIQTFELSENLSFQAGDGALIRRTVLPSGVRVLTETVPGAPSTAISLTVPVGSRDETGGHFGSTHFLEHLLFKGTTKRTARDISVAFDSVGGSANAATAKEYTSYYARVQNRAVPLALDILTDMFTSALLDSAEFETERTVIFEELAMNEDDPEDIAHEALAEVLIPGHELGRPIGGTPETILAVSRESVFEHYQLHYRPENLVIAAAGGVDHDELVSLVIQALADWGRGQSSPNLRRAISRPLLQDAASFRHVEKDTAQANVLVGVQSLASGDDRRYALGILSTALGGGMSSRLYEEIREKRGLAYSVYCYQQSYNELGYFGLYAGTAPDKATQAVELMQIEFDRLGAYGLSESEIELAKGNIAGSLALRFEGAQSRMSRLTSAELGTGEWLDLDSTVARFNAVTTQEIAELAGWLCGQPRSLVAVGDSRLKNLGDLLT